MTGGCLRRDVAEAVRREIGRRAEIAPARLEFEKRRFLASCSRATGDRISLPASFRPVLAMTVVAAAFAILWVVLSGVPEPATRPAPEKTRAAERTDRSDAIRAPADHGLHVVLADETALWLAPRAAVSPSPEATGPIVVVSGTVVARVTPRRPGDPPLVVATPHARALVLGTVLSAAVGPDRSVFRLHEGRVRVETGTSAFCLEAGDEATITVAGQAEVRSVDATGLLDDLRAAGSIAGPRVENALPHRARRRGVPASTSPDCDTAVPIPVPAAPNPVAETSPASVGPDDPEILPCREAETVVRSGDLAAGRTAFLECLSSFSESRYWSRVRDAIGDVPYHLDTPSGD